MLVANSSCQQVNSYHKQEYICLERSPQGVTWSQLGEIVLDCQKGAQIMLLLLSCILKRKQNITLVYYSLAYPFGPMHGGQLGQHSTAHQLMAGCI